jgi:hypothetical protein
LGTSGYQGYIHSLSKQKCFFSGREGIYGFQNAMTNNDNSNGNSDSGDNDNNDGGGGGKEDKGGE